MGIISWIIIGGLAGIIASKIMNIPKQGCITNIVIGIVGGLLGGFVMNLIGGRGISGFNPWSLLVATLGAVLLVWIVQLLRKSSR